MFHPIHALLRLSSSVLMLCMAGALHSFATASPSSADAEAAGWEQCGWGGGGFYYSTIYHPTKDGVLYLGGDVNGLYRSDDDGLHFKMINSGLASYGVFSLAVDQMNPDTVYAATDGGLCKSTDEGEHWQLLPQTGPKDLRITGEKKYSIRCIAVDPKDGKVVFAASPGGKVYKSTDGGQAWKAVYSSAVEASVPGTTRVQFGNVNGAPFGGIWFNLNFPAGTNPQDCTGIAFDFQGNKTQPEQCFVQLHTSDGGLYQSRNISDIFLNDQKQTVMLKATDFTLSSESAAQDRNKVRTMPATPDWGKVVRLDFACVGNLGEQAYVGRFSKFYFIPNSTPPGKQTSKQNLVRFVDLNPDGKALIYGDARIGDAQAGTIYSVSIAAKNPSLVLASSHDAGVVLSHDGGSSWHELGTPRPASCAVFAPSDPNIIYASFFTNGIRKSTDKGKTWTDISTGLDKNFAAQEVVVSPVDPNDVYAIGAIATWHGSVYRSHDGGVTWTKTESTAGDPSDPTSGRDGGKAGMSGPTNLAINPRNPQELFMSANWRACLSTDGGATWTERDSGADMSCVYDIRFSDNRTYVTAMDEGSFMSPDDGKTWRLLWPTKFSYELNGHNWRMGVTPGKNGDHLVATVSPWNAKYPNRVVVSDDGGATYKIVTAGLPDYIPHANTMWGQGYARALSIDPGNPNVVYLGIDGDPETGKSGGGIFKSTDAGNTWAQLEHQPESRRMFMGLQVDPTDSQRIFWGACGSAPGIYKTEDSGETWSRNLLPTPQWVFNLLVTKDGTVYCPSQNLWRSTDHGATWRMLTRFTDNRVIVGLEVDPRDPKTIWISQTTWDGSNNGAVYKSTDDGATWNDITGNLPNVKPLILRFNPDTSELWAGGPGLYKIKQPLHGSTAANQ